MPSDLERDVFKDDNLKACYATVQLHARNFLGAVHHQCTNEFRSPSGAVVWTDHGVEHSQKLIKILDDLFRLPSVKAARLSRENKCILLCSVWLHDVGMFLRHPDFPNLNVQRACHGMLARTVLTRLGSKSTRLKELSNRIAEVCELHHRSIEGITASDANVTLLGNLLLMADALDIGHHRTSESKRGRDILTIVRNATPISEASTYEWWVNDCIKTKNSDIDAKPDNSLEITYTIDLEKLKEWSMESSSSDWQPPFVDVYLSYIYASLHRYLNGEHLATVKKRKNSQQRNIIRDIDVYLKLGSQKYGPAELGKRSIKNYKNLRETWSEQVSCYKFAPKVVAYFKRIKKKTDADHLHLFVFDRISGSIRYVHNSSILEINYGRDEARQRKFSAILSRQRIPRKTGIIGHIAYCGLEVVVGDLQHDPRRRYEKEDERLDLSSVMFYPLISQRGGRLYGVIMVNRSETIRREQIDWRFEPGDLRSLSESAKGGAKTLINHLEKISKPYVQ